MSVKRKIRRSQAITNYGVGSILDLGDESLMAPDISWIRKNYGVSLALDRLANKLGVKGFRMPEPIEEFRKNKNGGLPYYRFPRWLFCPSCRAMEEVKDDPRSSYEPPKCKKCKSKNNTLSPMRFVAVCERGHLQDINWAWWLHQKTNEGNKNCQSENIEFITYANRGSSLASLEIHCRNCDGRRTLNDLNSKISGIGRCHGKQPWERFDQDRICKEKLSMIQSGASNLYYPKIISALDIPTIDRTSQERKDDKIIEKIKDHFAYKAILEHEDDIEEDRKINLMKMVAEDIKGASQELVRDCLEKNVVIEENFSTRNLSSIKEEDLLEEEWQVLVNPEFGDSIDNFSSEESFMNGQSFGLQDLLSKVVLVNKLREVRVLTGFYRRVIAPENYFHASFDERTNWLPAYEVFGEGIFISFSEKAIIQWEKKYQKILSERLSSMQKTHVEKKLDFLPEPTIKFVLLHTFSHLLIRQLAFECGYAGSSLRERIYCDQSKLSGILIYTADGDSEGSLGGLVGQGRSDIFSKTILTCLQKAKICSSDPICKELDGQGMRGLNRAACHSCALLSETSCVAHNAILDRMLLVSEKYGFFKDVMENLENKL